MSAWTVEQYGGGLCMEKAVREGNIALRFEMNLLCFYFRFFI
jgi:hypothetical protein